MKTHNLLCTSITAFMALIFAVTGAYADTNLNNGRLKVPPSSVYQAIQGQSLQDTLALIAQRSGIVFKINTDLGKDLVTQSVAADNWNSAIKSLLVNYNFTAIQDGDNFKTVIISGHKNVAPPIEAANSNALENVLVVEPKYGKLPAKYQALPAGSVSAVDLPVTQLMNIQDHANVRLDLPMGQFDVSHDYTVAEQDGSQTWVGYLTNEGEGYRVFLSQGAAGIMGMLTTPDGSYNIESDQKAVYLVDTNKLQHAGFEGDAIIPSVSMLNAIVNANANTSQLSQLQDAVTTAKSVLTAAQNLVTKDTSTVNAYKTQVNVTKANLTKANSNLSNAQTVYNNAVKAYSAQSNATTKAALATASNALAASKNAYASTAFLYEILLNNLNAANNNLTAASASAAKALANYNQAVSALSAAQNAASTPTPSSPNSGSNGSGAVASTTADTPVVDLMVVYTTAARSQSYAMQRISLLVTASNQAYIDSNINMKLRLVHTEPTTYVENNSNSQALTDFSNGNGVFANISQTRVQYGADLVFLFRPLYAQVAGSCGTTYVEFASGSTASAGIGYGTISDGNAIDESGYYCAGNTFTHEIGHSLGLVHDREYTSFPGVFDYSYAWGVQGSFGTIMSYKTPVLMYFSTPGLPTQCAGQPCGYASSNSTQSSDQTSSVNYTAPIVANFMPTTTAVPVLN